MGGGCCYVQIAILITLVFKIFWLHICTVAGGADMSLIYTNVNDLMTHGCQKVLIKCIILINELDYIII